MKTKYIIAAALAGGLAFRSGSRTRQPVKVVAGGQAYRELCLLVQGVPRRNPSLISIESTNQNQTQFKNQRDYSMKSKLLKFATITLMPAAMLAFTSCSSTPQGESATMVSAQKGVPGGAIVETYKTTATVTGIDASTRKVTLVGPGGKKTTYTAGPEVINFDRIRIGDQVKVTAVGELVAYLRKNGEPPSDGEAAMVALAPKGAKPGGVLVNTVEMTARVKSLDYKRHQATLQFPDGTSKTFKVRADVDLTKAAVGDDVVIRTTEALAITVEKP
jgi:hypothetical protein